MTTLMWILAIIGAYYLVMSIGIIIKSNKPFVRIGNKYVGATYIEIKPEEYCASEIKLNVTEPYKIVNTEDEVQVTVYFRKAGAVEKENECACASNP